MSERGDLPPEHIAGPGIYQVVLYDPGTRTRFTLQIVSYHDFPAPVQRRMGFLRDIIIEPMSEAEVANFFGAPPEDTPLIGDGAAGDPLTPRQIEQLRIEMAEADEKIAEVEKLETEDAAAAEEAAAKRLKELREQLLKDRED